MQTTLMNPAAKKPPLVARLVLDAFAMVGAAHVLHLALSWVLHRGC